MSNVPNVPSSDLEAARAASRSLRSATPVSSSDRGYVRFDATRLSAATVTVRSAAVRPPPARFGASSWERLLDDAIAGAAGEAAFVMNDQGLVIANRGALDTETAEAYGARTQLALEQLETIADAGGRRRVLACDLGSRWLVGVRFALADDTFVTLGLLMREPPEGARRSALLALVDAAASQQREPTSVGDLPSPSTDVPR